MKKKMMTDDDRIKNIVESMTSETPSAANDDKKAHGLEEEFRLGDGGDINQAMQDSNMEDDDDPYGDDDDMDTSSPKKLPSSKDVLRNAATPKLFKGSPNVIKIILGGGR